VIRVRAKDALGKYGEDMAARYLESSGMTILDRNWRCAIGELDIIARDGGRLVVCEVKTRSSDRYGTPFEAVSPRKVRRMRQLVIRWLEDRQIHAPEIRFDVIGILHPPSGPATLQHLRGVE
jgi:putative endonuclease